jgi:hypothetical protein
MNMSKKSGLTEEMQSINIHSLPPILLDWACAYYVEPMIRGKAFREVRFCDWRGKGGGLQVMVSEKNDSSYWFRVCPSRAVSYITALELFVTCKDGLTWASVREEPESNEQLYCSTLFEIAVCKAALERAVCGGKVEIPVRILEAVWGTNGPPEER